jgi:hypothetical protein
VQQFRTECGDIGRVARYRSSAMRCLSGIAVLAIGCTSDAAGPADKPPKDDGPARKLAGVYPERFDCASIVSLSKLSEILGAPAKVAEMPPVGVSPGTPKPCNYRVEKEVPESWMFDFDCRDNYKKQADALFAEYRQRNAERIEAYNVAADAKEKRKPVFIDGVDAGVPPLVHPGTTVDVEVGAKAIDHNDKGLLFIDDDAPCYVRVIGNDATRRLALAQHIAKALTYNNAPMTPRAAK